MTRHGRDGDVLYSATHRSNPHHEPDPDLDECISELNICLHRSRSHHGRTHTSPFVAEPRILPVLHMRLGRYGEAVSDPEWEDFLHQLQSENRLQELIAAGERKFRQGCNKDAYPITDSLFFAYWNPDPDFDEFLRQLDAEGRPFELQQKAKKSRAVMAAMLRRESQESFETESVMTGFMTETSVSDFGDDASVGTIEDVAEDSKIELSRDRWLGIDRIASMKIPEPVEIIDKTNEEGPAVTADDLATFMKDLDGMEDSWLKLGFKKTLEKGTSALHYVSWTKDEKSMAAPAYRSRMIIRNCSPETARDFFLDDTFRSEWDDSRVLSQTLEDWNESGCQVARWVRKFPFFLRDREYLVARRIFSQSDRVFHCISKQTTHSAAPAKSNPWRVNSFLSSWRIAPLEDGSSCEIINFHFEDSGLSKNISKIAISRGMWAFVVKLEAAVRKYQKSGRNVRHNI